jgi:hypothetical protein
VSRSRPSPLTRSVAARCRRAVILPRRCLLAVTGVVCPAVPCEFTAAPRAVCSWVRCLLAAPTRPRLAPVRQLHLSPFTPFPPLAPLASPDTPCSYSLLVMAACVYGCTAYIPQLGALRPRRADPSSSRSSQARRADLSSPPSSQAPALSPSLPPLGPPPPFTGVQRCTGGFAVSSPRRPVIVSLQPGNCICPPPPFTPRSHPPTHHTTPTLGARGPFWVSSMRRPVLTACVNRCTAHVAQVGTWSSCCAGSPSPSSNQASAYPPLPPPLSLPTSPSPLPPLSPPPTPASPHPSHTIPPPPPPLHSSLPPLYPTPPLHPTPPLSARAARSAVLVVCVNRCTAHVVQVGP